MSCSLDILNELDLFGLLNETDRRALAEVVDHVELRAGDCLFEEGDPGNSLYLVHRGEMELFVTDRTGEKIVLAVAGKNDLFGELALLNDGTRTASAVALSDCDLVHLDKDDLILFFQKRPDAAIHMLAAMTAMLRAADNVLRTRVTRNVNTVVADDEARVSWTERISNWITEASSRTPYLIFNTIWFGTWIFVNTVDVGIPRFDPPPFDILTMIVSLQAVFLAVFVLASQKRQSIKDRVRADIDYQVNIKAEMEVASLHDKIDHLIRRVAQLEGSVRNGERSHTNGERHEAEIVNRKS